jgi:hypothetical protein
MKKKLKEADWYKLPSTGKDPNLEDTLKDMEKKRKKVAKPEDKWYQNPQKMPKLKEIFQEQFKPVPISEEDVDPEELKMGMEVEKEHTDDPKITKIIALQHLAEDPKYYTKLKKMENEGVQAFSI